MDHPTVFIVDDDAAIRDSLAVLLGMQGLRVQAFADAQAFLGMLEKSRPSNGCVLLDIRLGGMGGLELQREIASRKNALPVIVMTGHPSVAAARMAFKAGAIDFLSKPLSMHELKDAIDAALHRHFAAPSDNTTWSEATNTLQEQLTTREHQILMLLAKGWTSREIAAHLIISHRTVETYKTRMMQKLKARKITDLVRIALADKQGLLS